MAGPLVGRDSDQLFDELNQNNARGMSFIGLSEQLRSRGIAAEYLRCNIHQLADYQCKHPNKVAIVGVRAQDLCSDVHNSLHAQIVSSIEVPIPQRQSFTSNPQYASHFGAWEEPLLTLIDPALGVQTWDLCSYAGAFTNEAIWITREAVAKTTKQDSRSVAIKMSGAPLHHR